MFPPAAQIPQGGGGFIQHGVLAHGAADLILQRGQVRQFRMPGGDTGTEESRSLKVTAQAPDRGAEARNGTELRGQQHAALQRFGKTGFRSVRFRQRRRTGILHHAAGGGRFLHTGTAKPFVHDRDCSGQHAAGSL